MAELIISSKDNQYVKLARGLVQKKQRDAHGMFLAEGRSNIREALLADLRPAFLLYDAERADDPQISPLLQLAADKKCPVLAVTGQLLQAVSPAEASQGLLLALYRPQIDAESFADMAAGKSLAVLDGLQDPGNVGTILRTAWAAGLGGVLLVNDTADVWSPKVVRSAMGALYHLPVLALSNEEGYKLLDKLKLPVAVADAGGEDFRTCNFGGSVAWLLGKEATGPSAYWRQAAAKTVAIPMQPGVDSLNVAVAAGILFFSNIK